MSASGKVHSLSQPPGLTDVEALLRQAEERLRRAEDQAAPARDRLSNAERRMANLKYRKPVTHHTWPGYDAAAVEEWYGKFHAAEVDGIAARDELARLEPGLERARQAVRALAGVKSLLEAIPQYEQKLAAAADAHRQAASRVRAMRADAAECEARLQGAIAAADVEAIARCQGLLPAYRVALERLEGEATRAREREERAQASLDRTRASLSKFHAELPQLGLGASDAGRR